MQRIRGHVVSSPTDTLRTQFLNLKFSGHSRKGGQKDCTSQRSTKFEVSLRNVSQGTSMRSYQHGCLKKTQAATTPMDMLAQRRELQATGEGWAWSRQRRAHKLVIQYQIVNPGMTDVLSPEQDIYMYTYLCVWTWVCEPQHKYIWVWVWEPQHMC